MRTTIALRDMDGLRREIDRAFETFFPVGGYLSRGDSAFPIRRAQTFPPVNLSHNKETIQAEFLAPGIDPASLEISVEGEALHVSGERQAPEHVGQEKYYRIERFTGKFGRTVQLPAAVDAEKVTASYVNGLLIVTLPKAESAKPRAIPVAVG